MFFKKALHDNVHLGLVSRPWSIHPPYNKQELEFFWLDRVIILRRFIFFHKTNNTFAETFFVRQLNFGKNVIQNIIWECDVYTHTNTLTHTFFSLSFSLSLSLALSNSLCRLFGIISLSVTFFVFAKYVACQRVMHRLPCIKTTTTTTSPTTHTDTSRARDRMMKK